MSNDLIFQEFKLYIEGVQVPFTNIAINQGYGSLPSASIAVPPQAGLMDIAKFYQPKVHIFFTETFTGKEKVLFTGVINSVHYSKSVEGSGSIGIMFECLHRYSLISDCLLDYSGAIRDGGRDIGGANTSISESANSKAAILQALEGCVEVSTGPSTDFSSSNPLGPPNSSSNVLPSYLAGFSNRLIGMPGVFINFWNQLQRQSFNPAVSTFQGIFKFIYKPLIEDGLQFFKRMTGHMVIEKSLNDDRQPGCGDKGDKNILIPPSKHVFLRSAIQATMSVEHANFFLQDSGEMTNLYQVFDAFYRSFDYDIVTLSSPAEVAKNPNASKSETKETYAVDTIVKPSMPFYFSPSCNVLYPNMYTSISVSYDEANLPTRIDVLNNEAAAANAINLHYRAPASIRKAIADKLDTTLRSTTSTSFGAIGKYELGRGIKFEYLSTPNWLASVSVSSTINTAGGASPFENPSEGSKDYRAIEDLKAGWSLRYPNDASMNPWDLASDVPPHERIMYATADYYYTKKFASVKAGSINCLFNPYIVPGYPMDVLEASPELPSFHGLCVAVSHNIGANGLSTSVSIAGAMTYTELANYYIPFINPYLQVTLGLARNPTLVANGGGEFFARAKEFYEQVLGVPGVMPETIFNFSNGKAQPVKMSNGILVEEGSGGDYNSPESNLALVRRPIESKADFASRFNLKYIDLEPHNYTPTAIKYADPSLSSDTSVRMEIGQSQFLDYGDEAYRKVNGITK